MPRKLPGDVKPVVERTSIAGLAVAGGQPELVERLSKVLDELRASGGVVFGGGPVADWSQEGGWFRDLNDGWSQAGGWVRTAVEVGSATGRRSVRPAALRRSA